MPLGLAYSVKAGKNGILIRDDCSGRVIGERRTKGEARRFIAAHWALRRELAEMWVKEWATFLEREYGFDGLTKQFQQQRELPNYSQALDNYTAVLWRWAHEQTPASVLDGLHADEIKLQSKDGYRSNFGPNALHAPSLFFILSRSVFLEGLRHGTGKDLAWWGQLSKLAEIAHGIGDLEFFHAMFRRPKPAKGATTDRTLKYALLACWISAGVWHARSRDEQWAILERTGWSKHTSATKLRNAESRLGLYWFKPSSA